MYRIERDSVARHLTSHSIDNSGNGNNNDSKRPKRACEHCRKGKTKCDGEEAGCLRCLKRGLKCVYMDVENDEDVVMRDAVAHETISQQVKENNFVRPQTISIGLPTSVASHEASTTPSIFQSNGSQEQIQLNTNLNTARLQMQDVSVTAVDQQPQSSFSQLSAEPLPHQPTNFVRSVHKTSTSSTQLSSTRPPVIDLRSLKIQKDTDDPSYANPESSLQECRKDVYIDGYFQHFHQHWLLIHRVMSSDFTDYSLVFRAVRMIGSWVERSEISTSFALSGFAASFRVFFDRLVSLMYTFARYCTSCAKIDVA